MKNNNIDNFEESDNNLKEEVQKQKKIIGILTIIGVILIFIILIFGFYIFISKSGSKSGNTASPFITDNESNKNEIEEVNINNINSGVNDKLTILTKYLKTMIKNNLYEADLITVDKLSANDKRYIALSLCETTQESDINIVNAVIDASRTQESSLRNVCNSHIGDCVVPNIIDKEVLDNKYLDFFNEKINYNVNEESLDSSNSKFPGCVKYYYISSVKKYYKQSGCGDIYDFITNPFSYIKTITKDKDSYYIDQYVGDAVLDVHTGVYSIYNDLKHTNLYKTTSNVDEVNALIINDSNYKDFTHLKWIFKKGENGNYYFYSVEFVK